MTCTVECDGQEWSVSASDDSERPDHTALFTGPRAQERAERYARLLEETDGELV